MSRALSGHGRSPLAAGRWALLALAIALVASWPSPAVAVAADLIPTSIELEAPGAVALNEPVLLTATVSPDPGGGWITFSVDGWPEATMEVPTGGVVSWTHDEGLSYYGEHSIAATYLGSATHDGSSASALIEVLDDRIPVTVSLTSSPNPSLRGDPVTFTATVSPNPGEGDIALIQGASQFAVGTLGANGKVIIEEPLGGSGPRQIKACFSGTDTHQDACSSSLEQVVNGIPSTTTLTIEPATVYPDESFTIGVTVSPAPETPTTVWVGTHPDDHRVPIGVSGPSGHGEATLMPGVQSGFPLGSQDLRAYFPGEGEIDPSVSNLVRHEVRLDEPTLVTSVEAEGFRVGNPLTLSASVSPLPIVESAGVGFMIVGPASSGFGDNIGVELGLDGIGQTSVDTDGWPAGDYWYDAACCGDPHLATTTKRGEFSLIDEDAPTGVVSVAGGGSTVATSGVKADVVATDGVGSGVQVVALSNDGTNWTTMPYKQKVDWSLSGGDGTKTVHAKWRDQAGNWSAVKTDTIVLDASPPVVTGPRRGFAPSTGISGGAILLRVPWTGTDSVSGIARYELQQQTDGGAWTIATVTTYPAFTRAVATEHTYRFRVRATDKAGNTSAWANGDTFRVSRISENNARLSYGGTWTAASDPAFWGGAARSSSTAGSSASLTFTGRSIAWVARMGPGRGKAEIYVNGSRVATVDLYSASSQDQRLAWVGSWTTAAARKVTIKVLGTSGRPRVDLDAIVTAD